MADNVGYTPGTGATVAADEIGGVLHQRVKISVGSDGSATDWDQSVTANNAEVLTDNAAFTDGTSKLFMGGYIYDETAGTALTENDAAAARIDSKRAVVGVIEDATTRGRRATVTASNALKVDGSGVTQPVSGTVNVSSISGSIQVEGRTGLGSPIDSNPIWPALAAYDDLESNGADASGDTRSQTFVGDLKGRLFVAGSESEGTLVAQRSLPIGGRYRQPRAGPYVNAENKKVDASFSDNGELYITTEQNNPPYVNINSGSVSVSANDATTSVSISTSSGSTAYAISGMSTVTLKLTSLGTGGTVVFEISSNSGSGYDAIYGYPTSGGPLASGTSATGTWTFPVAGKTHFRVRATALTSGTITGTIAKGQGAFGKAFTEVAAAMDSTGIGVQAAGIVGQLDDTSTATVTENQFAPVRISSRRALLVEGVASGTALGADVQKLNGTTTDTNSGNKSAGTLRVVLATDQPQLTNKLLVTPDANSAVNISQMNGVTVSMGAGATGTGVQRVVQANDAGKTLLSKTGTVSSSGNNTIVSAGTNKLKVFALTLSMNSTSAVTVKFQDGAGGTDLWSADFQAPSSISTGATLAVSPPAYLFATSTATLLNINLSAAVSVRYAISYFDEA